MDANTYQTQFDRTCADVFFPKNVSPIFLGTLLASREKTAEIVDAAKRGLFYNNTDRLERLNLGDAAGNDIGLPYFDHPDIIHAVLGMEGEVAEITEAALSEELSEEQKRAKILDESGDFLWYLALLYRKHGITFGEAFAGNIAKLKKRFPDKFTTDLAVNRDLEAEAEVFGSTDWLPDETIKVDGGRIEIRGPDAQFSAVTH